MEELTEKQEEMYNAIKDYILFHGYSPSVRDLCEITGKRSTATVLFGLRIFKQKGYISTDEKISRSIKVLK